MSSTTAAHLVPLIRCGATTSIGHRRSVNEDSFSVGPGWFVVADGMGGHGSGDVASAVVVETFHRDASAWCDRSIEHMQRLLELANANVIAQGIADGTTGMGSTVVGVTLIGRPAPAIVVFHVGDSRCYQLAAGRLSLLTTDHSHVQELVDAGELDPASADRHPLRNVVTRAVGIDHEVRPDVRTLAPRPMRLMLCSDGLSGDLSARTIGRVLTGFDDPSAAADRLVELTLAGPARDNVTAVVVDITFDEAPADAGWSRCP